MKIFCDLFPHLGDTNIGVVDEISNLRVSKSDTLESFLTKTAALQRKLDNTNQICLPNSVVNKFIKELRRDPFVEVKISTIFLECNDHIHTHGANVAFHKSPYEIYKFLKKSGVPTNKQLDTQGTSENTFSPTTCEAHFNEQ